MNRLPFLFPVTFVTDNVLEVFVALNIVGAHDLRGVPDDLLRQSDLARYLDSKRTARPSDGQLEERTHLVTVVEHGTVDDTLVRVGEMFEVLIVGGDHCPSLFLTELLKHTLGDGPTDLRLRSRTKLINEDQSLCGGLPHHVLHVEEMRRIR